SSSHQRLSASRCSAGIAGRDAHHAFAKAARRANVFPEPKTAVREWKRDAQPQVESNVSLRLTGANRRRKNLAGRTKMTTGGGAQPAVAGGPASHIPVLAQPAIEHLKIRDGGIYID